MLERVLTNCRLPRKYGSLLCWFMLAFHRQHSHWNRWCSSTVVHGTGMNMLTLWSIQRTRVKMLNACRSNSVTWKKKRGTPHFTHTSSWRVPTRPFTVWSYFSPSATRNAPSFLHRLVLGTSLTRIDFCNVLQRWRYIQSGLLHGKNRRPAATIRQTKRMSLSSFLLSWTVRLCITWTATYTRQSSVMRITGMSK